MQLLHHYLHPCNDALAYSWSLKLVTRPASCHRCCSVYVSCSVSFRPARLLCAKLPRKIIFCLFTYFCVWAVEKLPAQWKWWSGVTAWSIVTPAALWLFSPSGWLYVFNNSLDGAALLLLSSTSSASLLISQNPPHLPPLNLPLLPAVIMMIGSGPAAIYSPPSFLTNHYLHFHYSYCSLHMPWLYRFLSFFSYFYTLPNMSLEEYAVLIGWRALINFQYRSPSPTHTYTLQRRGERERERESEEDTAGIAVDVNLNLRSWAERTSWIKECLSTVVKVFIFLFESRHAAPPSLWWWCANL